MAGPAALIGATLGFALVLGGCSNEILGKPVTLGTGTGGTSSGTGDSGMSTRGQGGASSGGGGDTGNAGDGGSSGGGAGFVGGAGDGTVAEGGACVTDSQCAGMLHFCLRSACDAPTGACTAMPSEASCGPPDCTSDDPPCVPPSSYPHVVCGCDHVTYADQCHAWAHGASIDFAGTCAPPALNPTCSSLADCVPDGGAPASSYAKVLACVPSYCGSPFGMCVPIGQACLSTLPTDGRDLSVCSCSFTTFSNVCVARAQGADVVQPDAGACPTTSP